MRAKYAAKLRYTSDHTPPDALYIKPFHSRSALPETIPQPPECNLSYRYTKLGAGYGLSTRWH
jgi:hypothetical protein